MVMWLPSATLAVGFVSGALSDVGCLDEPSLCRWPASDHVMLQTGQIASAEQGFLTESQARIELLPAWATEVGTLDRDASEANLTHTLGFLQDSDELMRFGPTAKEKEHFNLVKAERQRGFTCPDGTNFPPNYGEFKWDCRLSRAARKWSQRMAAENFIAHRKDGSTSCTRTAAEGFPKLKGCGENIAGGESSAQAAVNQLKKSNNHCKNMFEPKFNKLGVGFASNPNSKYRFYWTDSFGDFPRGPDESCTGGAPAPAPAPGCADQDLNCYFYKNEGLCNTPNVERVCRDTCSIDNCGYGVPAPGPAPAASGCADTPGQACSVYREKGYCSNDRVRSNCAKTCGACSGGAPSSGCADTAGQACSVYREKGYCSNDRIKSECAKTCGACSGGTPSSGCADTAGQACSYYRKEGYCSDDRIKSTCAKTCGACR